MTITSNIPTAAHGFRYENPALICGGASMRAQCRQLATVVTVKGDVDRDNIDQIDTFASRFILAEKPIVLDLSGVNSIAPHCISFFYDVDDQCAALGVDWAVVINPVLIAELGLQDAGVPITGSVPEALHHFAEGNLARRRLLPLLTKSA